MMEGTRCVSVGLCLGMCFAIIVAQGLQPDHKSRYPVSTFISTMSSELISVHGNCSFPPSDVLTRFNSYDFLEMCDRKMPSLEKPVFDVDAIMCLGLLELGVHLCTLESKYFNNNVLFALPNDSESFNSLILALNQQDSPNICTDLKKTLDALDGHNFSEGLLKNWSLQKVFSEKEESCSKICFDYTDKPQLLCKLILWGSNVLLQPEPKIFQVKILDGVKDSIGLSNNSVRPIGVQHMDKSGHVTGSNQGAHDEKENQDNAHNPKKDSNTSTVMPSFSNDGSVVETMPVMKSSDNKSQVLNKTDPKENGVKSTSDKQSEAPVPMVSVEDLKNTDSLAGPSTTGIGQEIIINEDPQKSITKPSDAALLDSNKLKDNFIDEKSAFSLGEKMPTDTVLRDDFRDHYDSSFDQNQDIDDEVNFPPVEQEQPVVNQETTGSKKDYKYSQDQFTNANTFLQERFEDSEDSHFFSYFMAMVVLCIVGYVVFHNKQKILALALEGRSKRTTRRRPTTANYHKLDNNLEEAVSSPCNTSVTHVIY